jgi:uncharacterized membrane protein YvlD (DUF360 family)
MDGEISIGGVFVPSLLVVAIMAYIATIGIKRLLRMLDLYRFVWHAGLFDMALYVLLLWAVAEITTGMIPIGRG